MSIRSKLLALLAGRTTRSEVSRSKSTRRSAFRRLVVEQMEDRRLMAVIDLATLSATQGTTIFGAAVDYRIGFSVSDAGDVNGDGFEDLIIGAPVPDTSGNGKNDSGESYLIFGSASLPATIDLANLATLGPTVGITIYGADAVDFSGISVSSAGDVNGDGFDDLIIGAQFADAFGNLKSGAGESSVIFGKADWSTTPTINLASLGQVGQPAGLTIVGADIGDQSGIAVSSAGDVNGDGFDDLIIGANFADALGNARPNAGDSYIIFGAASLPTTIDLNNLGSAGITIFGEDADDEAGISVSTAGDVNGDGFDDILIAAKRASASDNLKNFAGETYLIFGGDSLPATIFLATPDFFVKKTIFGADIGDQSGNSVSAAGDINGDGFDDLLVAALFADGSGNLTDLAGDNYVIFGAASLPQTIDLLSLGSAGITIFGADAGDRAGNSVSSAGDVNGDGFDDLIIGSRYAAAAFNNKALAGESYVIFGAASLPTTISLNTLGSAGITIFGAGTDDQAGASVSGAGDVNGDGFDDLIIGAPFADAAGNLKSEAGESYVVFGGNGFTGSVTHLGTTASETLTGTSAANRMVGGRGNDTLSGEGGADILIGGQGNDLLRVSDLLFSRIDGGSGSDTLALNVSGLTLDLTTKRDNRILGTETIDITGIGNNTLVLNQLDVLNISDSSNALQVRGNAGDRVFFEAGWSQGANQTIGPDTFQVFTKGLATLRVSVGVTVRINAVNLARIGIAGTTIFGADISDRSGFSVSDAGDVNGDGFDDLIIGAYGADAAGNTIALAGESYLIFGAASLAPTIDLANLGSAGITIFGADAGDRAGNSVSSAGDVNGDGFDDLIIGAYGAEAAGNTVPSAGESYVVFGKADWSATPTIDLASFGQEGQPAGMAIFGAENGDFSGRSVSSAGDLNGDGFDDLVIGAFSAGSAGKSYVIFGGSSLPVTIDLANLGILGPTVGITVFGADAGDRSGTSVSSAGDVNGDGFDDLIIGAVYADAVGNSRSNAGESYVIFGAASLPATIELATLGQSGQPSGITMFGADAGDLSGLSVSSAGDVNGDGFDDMIIGARVADAGGNSKDFGGETYLVFGAASLPATIDFANLGVLGPTVGITIFGADAGDFSGSPVSSAGDINGDGFDDLIIGAMFADAFENAKPGAGESYVIFGAVSLPATIDLANLNALGSTVGITIYGADTEDRSGISVRRAGDVNGDGFGDFIIGSRGNGFRNLETLAGESYLIFGGNSFTSSVTHLGTTASETLTGNASANTMVGGRGNDVLIGAGGADVLIGGIGNDTLAVSDLNFRKVVGGNGQDTLRLDGSGLTLNLTNFSNNRILGIETIDITGTGNNTLQLTRRDLQKLSDQTNALLVRGNAGDTLAIDQGWIQSPNQVIGPDTYQVFLNGPAVLRVLVGVAVREAFVDLQSPTGPKLTIVGAASNDNAGTSVNNVGDVNADGFDDFVVGAPRARGVQPADTNAGVSYLIFGGSTQPPTIDLLNLGTAGVSILGADFNDFSGTSVAGGDVNGDGFDDIVIGAPGADTLASGAIGNGKTYVIFGRASFPATLDLSSSTGPSLTILGLNPSDDSGFSVSVAGDLNGDGYDDILIGARFADSVANGRVNAGESYIVFGAASFPTVLGLAGLGTGGVTLFGRDTQDISGAAVSGAGDVNGDGFDDLLIGAYNADALNNAKSNAGEAYLIYGRASFPATMDLFDPAQINVTLFGADISDRAGISVSGAGDVNGDGFDDILIGADGADGPTNTNSSAGETYLVFGGLSLPSTIDLGTLGNAGMILFSSEADDRVGSSVAKAGDINADGFDDILIGARFADGIDNGTSRAGESYVVFGKASLPSTLNLGTLGTSGLTVFGIDVSDASGAAVNSAGDVNGDGFDDLLVGAYFADGPRNSRNNAGEAYLIFGGNGFSQSVTQLGTINADTLTGNSSINLMVGGRGDDTLNGAGGADVLIGGQGNDILTISDLNFRRVVGGSGQDTLRLVGNGLALNLTTIRDNRIQDIENIDIKGAGNNTLTLTAREVLNLSSQSNTLVVRRDLTDIIDRGAGWTQLPNEILVDATFEVFQQGLATLKIQSSQAFVDFGSPNYVEAGSWVNSAITGFNGTTSRFASAANATATWNAPSLTPGYYEVALYKVAAAGNSTNAQVSIVHNGITEPPQTINLTTSPSGFVTLGTFFFSGAPGEFVRLSQGTTVANLRADAVRFSNVAVANATPTINAPLTQTVPGNAPRVFSTANANVITVADIDAGLAQVQLALSATNGLLTLPSTAGITFTSGANGQASFTIRGTLSSLNTALNGLSYHPNLNFTGSTSIQVTLNDLGNTGTGGAKTASHSMALSVSSPIFIVDNGTAGYVEAGAWSNSAIAGFNGSNTRFANTATATATWNAPSLAPGYYEVALWKVAVPSNSSSARVTIVHNGVTEPAQAINLSTVGSGFVTLGTFFFSGAPGELVRLSQGPSVGNLRADAVRFTRLPVANATPSIVAPLTQTVAGNTARVFSTANANAITVADADAGLAQVQLTLAATNGLLTLPSTAGLTFTSGANGQASFTVRGTLSSLNTALNGLSYQPNLNFTGSASIQLTLNDLGNTGTGGAKSASASIALTVNSPIFIVDNGTPGYVETGAWVNSALTGFNGTNTRFATAANAVATWNAPTLAPGFYSVAIWRVASASNSNNARVTIVHNGITESPLTVDLSTGLSGFFELGTFFFSGAPGEQIRLSQGTTLGNLRADAVRFTKLP